MAEYYVDSTATGGANTGGSWANAYLTFAQGIAAAGTAGDFIYVSSAHNEALGAATTYTFLANVRVICRNSGTGALATGGTIGAQSANYDLTLNGAFDVYIYGMTFQNGTSGTARSVTVGSTDGAHFELESCTLFSSSTGASPRIALGLSGSNANSFVSLNSVTFRFASTGSGCVIYGQGEWFGCSINAAGSVPASFIRTVAHGSRLLDEGCDFSHLGSGTFLADQTSAGPANITLANCKLGASMVMMAAPATILNRAYGEVWAFNCSSGDDHYSLYHGNAFGETYVSATVYANDGASYDGTNEVSWQIVTRASNCSYFTPYVSPWVDVYHTGTAQIAPYFEALRSGSTTKYQTDEVWAEFSFQGTASSTRASGVNDRMLVLGTAADQTASSKSATDWTGEDATNNAFMKLGEQNLTPAEIGHIRGRVIVGEPNITIYVDPLIRGLS